MSNREAFLAETKAAREARKADRNREIAAVKIQSTVKGWLQRNLLEKEITEKVDNIAKKPSTNVCGASENEEQKPTALELYRVTQSYLAFAAHTLVDDSKK